MNAEHKGQTRASSASGPRQGKAKVARVKAKSRVAEREHYARRIAVNEERLRTGLTADGPPMTAHQIETTRQIIEQQREKLNAIS